MSTVRLLKNPFSAKERNQIEKFKRFNLEIAIAHCAVCNEVLYPEDVYGIHYELKENEVWPCKNWGNCPMTEYPIDWIYSDDSRSTLKRKVIRGVICCKSHSMSTYPFKAIQYPSKKT